MEMEELEVSMNECEEHLLWRRLELSKSKLKGVTEMAALMAGFSVVATVELEISNCASQTLLVSFAVATACLVSTTMISIMIATCILPHVEAAVKMKPPDDAPNKGARQLAISLAASYPHDALVSYVDLAWFLANTLSIFLFIVDVILLCWIKFPYTPAVCITVIMIPVLILLCVFSIVFYRQTVHHQIEIYTERYDELQRMSMRLAIGSTPRPSLILHY